MRKYLIELYQLLTAEQRKRLVRLQVLVILMSFSEVAGVMSIAPFMTVVGDLSYLKRKYTGCPA